MNGVCRECGCTEFTPCIDDAGNAFSWAAADLCSFCAASLSRVQLFTEGDLAAELRRIDAEVAAIRAQEGGGAPGWMLALAEADWEAERYLVSGGVSGGAA